MRQREMNFIRSTARGIKRAMAAYTKDETGTVVAALTEMTAPADHLTSEQVGYYALMYLIAHDWEVPENR